MIKLSLVFDSPDVIHQSPFTALMEKAEVAFVKRGYEFII